MADHRQDAAREESALLRVCIEAARGAAEHAARHKPRRSEIHQRFAHDVKLELDLECQRHAFQVIHAHFPGDALLGEEEGGGTSGGTYEWVVDPIDGTLNFFHGLPWWCSSVAVRNAEGDVLAGAVCAPEQRMLFDAVAHGPARLNGEPCTVSDIDRIEDALCITGSEKELDPGCLPLATAQQLAAHVQKVRILGAAALDICQVACGAADLFLQRGLYIWDVAAAGLIVRRAGGVYRERPTPMAGRYCCLAAANQALFDQCRTRVEPKDSTAST